MIRVKDKDISLRFYQDVMGMKLKRTSESPNAGFNLYFLGYGPDAPQSTANGVNPGADHEGLLELTWNYGTEKDDNFKYHNGNEEPQGFGHICIAVDDLDAACARFEEKRVNWKKRLTDGRMKNIAFVLGMWFANTVAKVRCSYQVQILTTTGSKLCKMRSSRHVAIGNCAVSATRKRALHPALDQLGVQWHAGTANAANRAKKYREAVVKNERVMM